MPVAPFSFGKCLGKSLPEIDRGIRSPRFDGFQIKVGVKLEYPLED
jgi:hypothetical protein